MLAKFLHRCVRILRLSLFRRRIALPFIETAARRVILQLVNRLVSGAHELAGHGVGMRELTLGRIVDDISQREIERLVAKLERIGFVWFLLHRVEEKRVNGGWLFS